MFIPSLGYCHLSLCILYDIQSRSQDGFLKFFTKSSSALSASWSTVRSNNTAVPEALLESPRSFRLLSRVQKVTTASSDRSASIASRVALVVIVSFLCLGYCHLPSTYKIPYISTITKTILHYFDGFLKVFLYTNQTYLSNYNWIYISDFNYYICINTNKIIRPIYPITVEIQLI